MSSGKFSFELNEETSRGQSGLGIALHDAWTGHRQDPRSLSGGETFYAALSLALGLADVVRGEAGGTALETLFIDEGFGSLDQDTLYQVLDQLDHLRSGRRVVGVISHVTEMKESIPDRIEVRRGEDSTSSVTRPTGVPSA
jgi:exonuclease SbcC